MSNEHHEARTPAVPVCPSCGEGWSRSEADCPGYDVFHCGSKQEREGHGNLHQSIWCAHKTAERKLLELVDSCDQLQQEMKRQARIYAEKQSRDPELYLRAKAKQLGLATSRARRTVEGFLADMEVPA